jgi:hypothetical protein
MNIPIQKIIGIALTLFFLSSCAVFVRDEGHYHRGHWRGHSSLQQSDQSAVQMIAQNGGEAQEHNQARPSRSLE